MAGILIALGSGIEDHWEDVQNRFESLKGLLHKQVYCSKLLKVAKYCRNNEAHDVNWFESDQYLICAVGTILYADYGIDESLRIVAEYLNRGISIDEILEEIDGHFLFIVHEKRSGDLRIITDVGGVINGYFIQNKKVIFIGTSMLALAGHFPVTVDERSVATFLRTGMFFGDTTYFNEVRALKPASQYRFIVSTKELVYKKYWEVPVSVNYSIGVSDAARHLKDALDSIVKKIPIDKAIFDFTGGYDARFVLSFVYSRIAHKEKINAFFFGPRNSREAVIVENNCRNLGLKYNNFVLPENWDAIFYDYVLESLALSDGMISAFEYAPVLWVQKQKALSFCYSFLGLFGEIYRTFNAKQEFFGAGRKRPANLERYIRYRILSATFNHSILSPEVIDFMNKLPESLIKIFKKTIGHMSEDCVNTVQLDYIYFSHRMRRWGGRSISTTNQIIRPICPLWFKKPLSMVFTFPPGIKKREKLMRYLMQINAPEMAKEKTISGTPFIPINIKNAVLFIPALWFYLLKAFRKCSEIVFNKSILSGLTTPDYDVSPWIQKALKDNRCHDLLKFKEMASKWLYEKQAFDSFIEKARSGCLDFYGQIGNIITIELVLRYSNITKNVEYLKEEN